MIKWSIKKHKESLFRVHIRVICEGLFDLIFESEPLNNIYEAQFRLIYLMRKFGGDGPTMPFEDLSTQKGKD